MTQFHELTVSFIVSYLIILIKIFFNNLEGINITVNHHTIFHYNLILSKFLQIKSTIIKVVSHTY